MAASVVVLLIILLPWPIRTSASTHCIDKCGEVFISYPFGVQNGCYFNEGFAVTCDNSTGSPKPLLNSINLEILGIYLGSLTVNVKVPVISSNDNCQKTSFSGQSIDLSGSPFYLSDVENRLAATGCDNYAAMRDQDNRIIRECFSFCTNETSKIKRDGCNGLNCCQTSIPPGLQFLNVSMSPISQKTHECNSAILFNHEYLGSSSDPEDHLSELEDKKYVPVALEWGKPIGTCYEKYNNDNICDSSPREYCWKRLSSGHLCRCRIWAANINTECRGDMICIDSPEGYNCSQCPSDYEFYRGKCHPKISTIAEKVSYTTHNCLDKCGDVSIRYPFGVREGCYANRMFEVICDYSSDAPRAFLSSINLELLEIQISNLTVRVKVPVSFSNCSNTSSAHGLDLSGSPFSISNEDNTLVAIGCDNHAKMINQNGSVIGGCLSTCTRGNSQAIRGCFGLKCCKATIPQDLKYLNSSISPFSNPENNNTQECRFSFMIEETWFDLYYKRNTNSFMPSNYVPAILEWGKDTGECLENVPITRDLFSGSADVNHWIPLSSVHFCSCYSRRGYPGYQCRGDLVCLNSPTGNNCSECPPGYRYSCHDCLHGFRRRCTNLDYGFNNTRFIVFCVGIGLAGLLLPGSWVLYKVLKRRKAMKLKKNFFKRNGGLLLQQQLSSNNGEINKMRLFTSKELAKATDNYNADRVLGQGGQGTVYKGMLSDGRIVAVKKSKIVDENQLDHFINEVVILSQVNHRNVVRLLGCCLETEMPLLIYEFVPNGTLYQNLHEPNEEFPISWEMRLRISVEVVGALSYLHSAASIPIYHRDIKSTNILLDEKYRAKVSDFGISRSVSDNLTHLSTKVQGTFGYLDPEYFRSSQLTEKSDVYSFGVVLAELLTGQMPIRAVESVEEKGLVAYFLRAVKENNLFEILDARVLDGGVKEEVIAVANLAKRCLNMNRTKRPTMKEVAMELEAIRASTRVTTMNENHEEEDSADDDISVNFDLASSISTSCLNTAAFSADTEPPISKNRQETSRLAFSF